MMRITKPIVQIGIGGVGRALATQVLGQHQALAERYGISLGYRALVDRSGALVAGDDLLAPGVVSQAIEAKQQGDALATLDGCRTDLDLQTPDGWRSLFKADSGIVVDVTAADGMAPVLCAALEAGYRVVLANKRPVTESYDTFCQLTAHGQTRYEATVGAGLPVISTLQSLLDTGDALLRIEASMSGTLGYLCHALEEDIPFSDALQTACSSGWTEPDPRDDLSGADVARKALILARTAGFSWTLDEIPVESWFPPTMATLSIDEFLEQASTLDDGYATRLAEVRAREETLRYVATIGPQGAKVGLRDVPLSHPLASLRGPDNLFVLTTRRYAENPLVVRGPGAGQEVTAAGVLGDIIAAAREQ